MGTAEVWPSETPESNASKRSPKSKASVTVSFTPRFPAVNVQGRSGANTELPAELGAHVVAEH
jgi:hypothetical protein